MNLFVILITGLTVGGLTCLAVQGGLLASLIATKTDGTTEENTHRTKLVITGVFLTSKLISHTLLGGLLGAFGSAVAINQNVQLFIQGFAGLYMITVALNLLNVHPIFRYVIIQPPKFLTRKIKNQTRSKTVFAPLLLGALTIFIPCGTTLAMESVAISSGGFVSGALVMLFFIAGTIPLFFGIGWLTSLLGTQYKSWFTTFAALAIIYLGVSSLNGVLVAYGSPITVQKVARSVESFFVPPVKNQNLETTQEAVINITSRGYSPNYIKVKNNTPVKITLNSQDAYSCATAFRIPSLSIAKNLLPNEQYTFTFTPNKVGKISFSCSMGMYDGVIEVI